MGGHRRRRTRYPVQKADIDTIRFFRDYGKDQFKTAAGNVRADIEQSRRPANVDNFAVIFAWNEWDEGAAIEPNDRDGCFFLDVIREELRLTEGDGCVMIRNRGPVVADGAVETRVDTDVAIELTGSDPDGDDLAFTVVEDPAHGDVDGVAPHLTYTPHSGYIGDDEISFTATDGTLTSEPATVSIRVAQASPEPTETPRPTETPSPTGSPEATDTPEPTESSTLGDDDGDGDLPDTGAAVWVLPSAGLIAVGAALLVTAMHGRTRKLS